MVDAFALGVGTVLVQADDGERMQVISYSSHIFTEKEQKNAVIYREITGKVSALKIYEFLINGSKHPITIFTDHKPILSIFLRKGNINPLFSGTKLFWHAFQNLVIFGHKDKNFA